MSKNNLLLSILLLSSSCFAMDTENGKTLFKEAACMECHNEVDFKRDEKKVNNFNTLNQFVQACQINDDVGWFDDESLDVANYLNQKYYKFKH